MTEATLELTIQENANQVEFSVPLHGETTSFTGPTPPLFVPSDQLYYWTRTWQGGEHEALADVAAGRTRVFTDMNELARYLLRPAD